MESASPIATQLAEALVRAGYMERADDEHDRRVTKLSLSSKGETMLKAAKKAKFAKVSQILTSLDDQEVQTLATLLKKVGQSIHEQGGKK